MTTDTQSTQSPWFGAEQAFVDEGLTNLKRMARLPFLWERSQQVRRGCTPAETVYEEEQIRLLHYRGDSDPKYHTPLVIVFALVNRPYILDLKPGKSVVQQFVRRGFDTYMVDWGVPTRSARYLTIDDYVNGYLDNIIEHVRQRTGADQVSVLGYCMGGTFSSIYTALHQEKIKNLMLLAAGIDFANRDGLLQVWTDPNYFDVDKFVDAYGNVPPHFLQSLFLMLKPVQNLLEKPINFVEKLDDEAFLEDYFAMEGWLNDNIPVPGEVFRQFVKYLYQRNLLVQNLMPVGNRIVNLRDITCPVLNIMATKDDLVPCTQSLPFNDLVASTDRKALQFSAGHIGLAVASKAQRDLWPVACDWLAARSEPA